MKSITKILSIILCFVLFISANIVGVEAASISVARTEKLVADKETASTVELRWRKVSKATGYKVYQVVDGKFKAVKTVKTNKYVVTDLTASETYKFAVKTYRKYNGKTYWSSKYRSVTATTKGMGKSPTPKATATQDSVKLNWSEVDGATGYRVYQYSPSKDKYVVKASVKGVNTYTVKGLKENTEYKFKIKPYAKTSKGVVWNKASSAVSAFTVDKTKAKFTAPVIGSKGVTLNWEAVPGATHYMIFTLEDGKYTKIATAIKATSYKVERLKSGEEYTFVVRGYKKVDGKVTQFTLSDPLTIKTKGTSADTETTDPTTPPATESTTKPTTTKPTTTKPTTTKPTTTKPTTTKPTTTKPTTTKPTTTKPTTTKPTEHTHKVVVDKAVEATCKKTGLTEGKHCSTCGEVIVAQKTVAKKAHTIVTDPAVAATCTKTGLTEGKHCSVCGEVTVAQKTVAKKSHSYTSTITKRATCSAEGVKTFKCSCGDSYTEAIAKTAHSIVTEYAVEATCTTTGLTEGKYCIECRTVTVPQTVVPMKNHKDSNKDSKCDDCGKKIDQSQPTTQPTTKPTTKPTTRPTEPPTQAEPELTVYRIAKYKKILDKETVYFKISSEYSDGTMVPIEFAMKNGNMFMETTAEGMTMRMYYDKKTGKMHAYAYLLLGWMYYEVPEDEMADMDMTEMLDTIRVGETGFISVSKARFNGKDVICESFLDTANGFTVKYYFDSSDTLVGIERTHPRKADEIIYVEKISNTVSDKTFNRPANAVPVPM